MSDVDVRIEPEPELGLMAVRLMPPPPTDVLSYLFSPRIESRDSFMPLEAFDRACRDLEPPREKTVDSP